MAGLLGHPRLEDHLQQQVAEFLADLALVALLDRADDLVRLLDDVGLERFGGLLAVPRAAVGRAQPRHELDEAREPVVGGVSVLVIHDSAILLACAPRAGAPARGPGTLTETDTRGDHSMSDERDKEGQPQGFKVSDRRKRYEEPAADAPAPAPARAAPEPAPARAPEPPPAAAQPAAAAPAEHADLDLGADQGLNDAGGGPGAPGPADFLQLIGKLYQEGLAFMGLFDDPKTGQSMANFPIASWHIDILGVLEEKTKGQPDRGGGQADQGGGREPESDLRPRHRLHQALTVGPGRPEGFPRPQLSPSGRTVTGSDSRRGRAPGF